MNDAYVRQCTGQEKEHRLHSNLRGYKNDKMRGESSSKFRVKCWQTRGSLCAMLLFKQRPPKNEPA